MVFSHRSDFNQEDPNEIVREYAANSPFRSAEAHELINEDNPFRRPVRPHDLGFLDYGKRLAASEQRLLSSLLGNRMLRNVYDEDRLHLPAGRDTPSWTDGEEFYSAANRIRGARAAAVLERHLFSFLAEEREPLAPGGLAALREHVLAAFAERQSQPGKALDVTAKCTDRKQAATFLLLQLTATQPAMNLAVGRNLLGDYDLVHPNLRRLLLADYQRWADGAGQYRELLGTADLIAEPAAYWQFFLGSSMSRANHLDMVARNHERLGEFIGAWLHKKIDDAVTERRRTEVVAEAFGAEPVVPTGGELTADGLGALFDELVAPLADRYGDAAVESCYAGFADARRLAASSDEDLSIQLDWADRLDEYQAKAEWLDEKIRTDRLEVDLETFVESSEETSTTHVHDDHRLVVVEVGQMHFWNNVGKKIPMEVGQKLLIPAERLHGSMVLSGTCTYHQPVISEELLAACP
ncbi:hypothetical protein AB0H34_33410 [Saccharopolyspora shandongensis]|uniref:hypothetical protein n=1 Tax=Saccharopolyspora shandongensis TaxID=418495 RepID=UPI0033CBA3A4